VGMFSFSKSNGGEGVLFGVGQFFLGKLRYITHPSFGVPFFAQGYCSVDNKAAEDMFSKTISRSTIQRFLKRHTDDLGLGNTTSLSKDRASPALYDEALHFVDKSKKFFAIRNLSTMMSAVLCCLKRANCGSRGW